MYRSLGTGAVRASWEQWGTVPKWNSSGVCGVLLLNHTGQLCPSPGTQSLCASRSYSVLTEGTREDSMGLVPATCGSQQGGPCIELHQSPGGEATLITTC